MALLKPKYAVLRIRNLAAAKQSTTGVQLAIGMNRQRRLPEFAIHDLDRPTRALQIFDAALAKTRDRGISRAVEILSRPGMPSAADFAKFIGVSLEFMRENHQRHEVLHPKGAKADSVFRIAFFACSIVFCPSRCYLTPDVFWLSRAYVETTLPAKSSLEPYELEGVLHLFCQLGEDRAYILLLTNPA